MTLRILIRALRILGTVVSTVAVMALAAMMFATTSGRYRPITVLTGSMRPTMPEGSVMVQVPIPVNQVQVGDVITYRIPVEDHRVISHRVVEIVSRSPEFVVITKGDANPAPDTWRAALLGETSWKTVYTVPNAGYVIQALHSPLARQLSFLLAPVMLALLWLRDIWHPRTKKTAGPAQPLPASAAP
jgi:signal peptidase